MPIRAASLPFLVEVVTLFALSAFMAYLCTRIRLVSNAGVLLTGVAVGPYALGLVDDPELVGTLAEIGVILLLFEIGIEFSLSKWARLKRAIGLGGGLQVGGTVVLVTGTGLWAGGILGPVSTPGSSSPSAARPWCSACWRAGARRTRLPGRSPWRSSSFRTLPSWPWCCWCPCWRGRADRLIVLGVADDLLACADLFRGRERGPRSSRPSSKIE